MEKELGHIEFGLHFILLFINNEYKANEEGPGLAMTRAFGDFEAQKIGFNSVPDTEIF